MNKGEIIIYQTSDGATALDVRLEQETIWLTQQQIADLFGTKRQADDEKHILLVSENPSYKPFPLPLADIYSLAIVVGVIRLE